MIASCWPSEYAVAVAASLFGVPLRIVRGASNLAGDRDHAGWRLADALGAVRRRVLELALVYGPESPVVIPLIQEDLAALAGTSRATVNRVLRNASTRGLVELQRGRTIVLEQEGLARLARLRS